jgi:hypothetical protein
MLSLNQNELTDEHILAMVKEKAPGPYFPQLATLMIE